MWMKAISISGATTFTPGPNEVWMLNSLTGFTGTKVSFGVANLPDIVVTGRLTTAGDIGYGSRTTLAPVFTSAIPLLITPGAAVTGIVSGALFTPSTAPYLPVQFNNVSVAAGARLSLQPPVGKLWRLITGTNAGATGSLFLDVSTDSGSSWQAGVLDVSPSSQNVLTCGRADVWSWRDKPLSLRAASATTVNAYLLEFNESDFLPYRIHGTQAIAASGTYDIRPPVGEEWVIDATHMTQTWSATPMVSGTPTTAITFSTKSVGPFRIDNTNYIRITNTSASSATLVYSGRKVN
jgi:hypothetical protein